MPLREYDRVIHYNGDFVKHDDIVPGQQLGRSGSGRLYTVADVEYRPERDQTDVYLRFTTWEDMQEWSKMEAERQATMSASSTDQSSAQTTAS